MIVLLHHKNVELILKFTLCFTEVHPVLHGQGLQRSLQHATEKVFKCCTYGAAVGRWEVIVRASTSVSSTMRSDDHLPRFSVALHTCTLRRSQISSTGSVMSLDHSRCVSYCLGSSVACGCKKLSDIAQHRWDYRQRKEEKKCHFI